MIGRASTDSPPCRFTVLGPPGLNCYGTELDLGSPQQQAVLMLLLVNSGRFVQVGELIDGLWGDRAPVTGEAVIRTYISRLRRMLSGHGLGSAIRSQAGGYLLDPSLFVLDAAEFADLVESARREHTAGNVSAAADHLAAALDLWTGTALAGVPGDAAERERSRLERLKLTATQELLRTRLELGEHAEVVAEVPLLIEQNRLEEPLYEIYLLALYRSGRRAEALEVYRTVYDLLSEEMGVGPGPLLQAIHEKILRADADVHDGTAVPRTGSHTARSGQVPGRGFDRQFIGRDAERAVFRAMLEGRERSGPLFVCGPAGIGKSTLLRKFADDARASGRQVWHLHDLDASERRERLEQVADELSTAVGPVLLLDSFEEFGDLEHWLRDEYLWKLRGAAIVVVAGRTGPSAGWLIDPAWSGTFTLRCLGALSDAESAALVEARGVARELRDSIVDFAVGSPLALSLAAEVGRSLPVAGKPSRRDAVRYVVDNVIALLVGPAPTAAHRWALHVCAHARYTTEDLLRAVVPDGQAEELFDWLRAQPFVETAAHGLDINGVLRESLEYQLRWRDPVGYEQMHRRIREYVMGGLLRDVRDPHGSVAVMRTIAHLRRRGGVVPRYVSGTGDEDLQASTATSADHGELIAMAREDHGESAAASVRFWLERQPNAFHLLRDRRTKRLRAFMSWLLLTAPAPEELAADPIVEAIWQDVSRRMELPAGAHVSVARHLFCPAGEAEPSFITDAFQARLMRGCLHEPGLAASYLVLSNGKFWRPLLEYLGHHEVETDHPNSIFGHDWLAPPPGEWRDRHLDEELWAQRRLNLFARQG
ncbi:DNA-binding transcriptional activator of the SARP family [Saccharopolyspora shandongensis]|uniref:DNA-binding transcriptional activator of the SARP family n=1 Tax=Saccharopolyspora shandongensis TaxID=418495 RepID=A0A1H3L582_9PSEU|nr:BTAD domain-containing putative transcriptional regulator [Saccharopolyspora shandongensis]SDY59573.1 DNA-binding transcriptional activator of the SARP family [Saccharopolyspora shandongensis]